MNIYALTALVNVATSIVLGALVLFADKKARLNRMFALFALSVALWSFAYFNWQIATDATSALAWTHLLMAGAIFITPIYFHFSTIFLRMEKRLRALIVVGYIFVAAFSILNWSPLYIANVRPLDGFPFWPIAGPLFLPFLLIWVFYSLLPIYFLVRALRETKDPATLSALKYILAGTAIGYAGGCTNYFLWYAILILPFGNISASIYLVLVAYATMRYQLFNMKVIAAELLTFSLWLFIFIRLVLAETTQDTLLDGGLLVVTLVVGVLLIRSVDKEVEQREEIERLSNEKSEFMSFASHEVRNPITAMRGYASLLVDGTVKDVSEQGRGVAQKILVNGDTVLALISEFLNKSKVELGQISYNMADTDLGKTITSIGEGFKVHAKEKGLTLDIKIDYPTLIVKTDEAKLREIVGNLIDNSVKYTKAGGVTVEVEKRNGMGRVIVSDTGVGIAPETISHLFQKFSRADAQKMNLLGTGLGLYLAKTFIEGMGGKIWVESDGPGKGSRFIIELHTV